MTMPRRLAAALLVLLLLSGGAGLFFAGARAQGSDTSFLGDLISRALSTPAQRVQVGSVEGALSSDATIRDIVISDREGPWLKLDSARLKWRRLALLQRRLEIDKLEVGKLEILRRPLPNEAPEQVSDEPVLPELPVKVNIADFQLRELTLGQPVLGTAASISASGAASLGAPAEGLSLTFDARRMDAPGGTFAARLSLVPQTNALTVTLKVDEPPGGLVSHVAGLPGEPPVKLDVDGDGTLDAFKARLVFTAGPTIGADGTAALDRKGGARELSLDLGARIEGLLPGVAAPIFAGTTRLTGRASFADDGAIAIPGIAVASQTARLDIGGNVAADRVLDLKVSARALPTQGEKTVAGGAEIRSLIFDGAIAGPATGPKIDAKLNLEDARLPAGRLAKVAATFTATPSGPLTDAASRIALNADVSAGGIALSDPALARAVGNSLTLTLRGDADTSGVADIRALEIKTQTASARFAGRAGQPELKGRLDVDAPDLSRFGDVASLALKGALDARFELSGVPKDGRIDAIVAADVARFSTGIAPLDGLAAGRLGAAGTLRLLPAGGYGFRDFKLTGAHVSAALNGTATVTAADIDALIDVPELKHADARTSGRAQITGKLTGTVEKPNLAARIALENGTLLQRPVPRLALTVDAADIAGLVDARIGLDGEIARKPAKGGLRLARLSDGGWRLSDLDVGIGSATAKGAVTLGADRLASGQLAVVARNLDDLSPLVLTRMSGDIDAAISLDGASGRQNAKVTARGQSLRYGDMSLERLDADLAGRDLYGRPVVDGVAALDRAVIAGETVSQVRFKATGTDAGSDLDLRAQARGFDLASRARLVPGDRTRLDIASFEAKRSGRRIALAGPASVTFLDRGVELRDLAIALDKGRVTLDGIAGEKLDLSLAIRAVPLSAAEIVQPGLGLSGTADGEARITGTSAAPEGDWRIRLARLVAPQTRSSGLPPLDVAVNGRLSGGRTTLDAAVNAGKAGTIRATGSLPLGGAGDLDLDAKGRIDLAVANAFLAIEGRRVTGTAAIDARIGGTLSKPRVEGAATLSGGTFTDTEQGIRLSNINGRLAARGDTVTVERLTATARNGGTIGAAGEVRLDADAGFPGEIRITGQRAELVSSGLVTAVADLALQISGPLAQRPRIFGRIGIVSMDVTVPDKLPGAYRPIENTRFKNPPPQARAKIAADAKKRGKPGKRAPAFNAALDLVIAAPNRIYVRGRGMDAELGGELRVTGTLDDIVPVGAFELRRGRFDIGSQRLNFARGRLAFTGSLTPELDFLAETVAGGVTARIGISGVANEPAFSFTSEPDLPQDEVLSRILFGKESGGLGPGQALQLAQIAAQFSGSGDGAFESLRKSLGVQGLDISLGAGGPGIGIQKAISDRISIGVKAGVSPEETGVSVDVDVTRRIRVQGEIDANGAASVGVGAEWEY